MSLFLLAPLLFSNLACAEPDRDKLIQNRDPLTTALLAACHTALTEQKFEAAQARVPISWDQNRFREEIWYRSVNSWATQLILVEGELIGDQPRVQSITIKNNNP